MLPFWYFTFVQVYVSLLSGPTRLLCRRALMHVALDFISAWHHHNVNLQQLCLAASHHGLRPTVYLYVHAIKWSRGKDPRCEMCILKFPTSWLISLGIATHCAIICPPMLSEPHHGFLKIQPMQLLLAERMNLFLHQDSSKPYRTSGRLCVRQ